MIHSALVTGGAGFIGSHVADALIGSGASVTILDDLSNGKRENVPAGARLIELDVGSAEAADVIRDGGFNVVCHLAAQMDVRRSVADPMFDATVNVVGGLNILNAAHTSSSRPRVVFASTGGALYGDFVQPPCVETHPKDPESPYGIAKLSFEYYMAYYARVHGLSTAALRFANIYGPRQDPHGEAGVVAIFCRRLLASQPLTVFGDGEQTRDYTYVGDVARAVLLAATRDLPRAAQIDSRGFNIGTGIGTSVLELARLLQQAAKTNVKVEHAPRRPGEQQHSFIDATKARRELGWTPEVQLADGLARTFRWFAERTTTQPG